MKVARAILTHRPEIIPLLKRYYLDGGITSYLVIAYNQASVDPKKIVQTENFKLFPYLGKGPAGSVVGQMFLVWGELAQAFPEVDLWIIHDYDVLVKPTDEKLASLVKKGEYGMVGKPFVYNRKAVEESQAKDLYPFLKSGLSLSLGNSNYKYLEGELLKKYPISQNGEKVILTGYGDFIVASREDLRLFCEQSLRDLQNGGSEQAPHTVFGHFGIKPVDLKEHFTCFVSLDNTVYADFKSKYDISHPVKFWPGLTQPGLKMKLRRFLKILLTDSGNCRYKNKN